MENVNKGIFPSEGKYQIPIITPEEYLQCEFIAFHTFKSCKERVQKGIHFFLDDYQFLRVWNMIDYYLPILSQFKCVMTPDFSTYADFPMALQIYNHYRKHWIGAYLQSKGVKVIPTISWSDERSYEWCFDGEPTRGTVAVSAIGTQQNKVTKQLFKNGYDEMIRRLQPETIIFYGTVPETCYGNIVRIRSFQEKFSEVVCDGW